MQLIETVTLASAASSIEFTSIPQDGVDLLLVCSLRGSNTNLTARLTLNNTTTLNYPFRQLSGNGTASSSATDNFSEFTIVQNASNSTGSTFTNNQIIICNYTSSSNKSVSLDMVSENNATFAQQRLIAGSYTLTSAVTSLQLITFSGDFVVDSTASLYKITAD
jgi:hypothetical protein